MKEYNILLVDDDIMTLNSLRVVLDEIPNINVKTATSGEEAIEIIYSNKIDLVISDQIMPSMSGIELFHYMRDEFPDIVRILITGVMDVKVAIDAINNGSVYNFLSKPWDKESLKLKVFKGLEHRELIINNKMLNQRLTKKNEELEKINSKLEEKVKERTKQIEDQIYQILQSLMIALEEKDKYTKGHSQRVEKYAMAVAEEMSLSKKEKEQLSMSAKLHDIGKIGIPESILNKPSGLSDGEFSIIKKHPEKSAKILSPLKALEIIAEVTKKHHERYDGNGYLKCSKEDIPLLSHILMVADTYDAMTSSRAYRKAITKQKAIEEIKNCSGSQFHPNVVEAFLKIIKKEK